MTCLIRPIPIGRIERRFGRILYIFILINFIFFFGIFLPFLLYTLIKRKLMESNKYISIQIVWIFFVIEKAAGLWTAIDRNLVLIKRAYSKYLFTYNYRVSVFFSLFGTLVCGHFYDNVVNMGYWYLKILMTMTDFICGEVPKNVWVVFN